MTEEKRTFDPWQLALTVIGIALSGLLAFLGARYQSQAEFDRARIRDAEAYDRQHTLLLAQVENEKYLAEQQEKYERERLDMARRREDDAKEQELIDSERASKHAVLERCLGRADATWSHRMTQETLILESFKQLRRSQSQFLAQAQIEKQGSVNYFINQLDRNTTLTPVSVRTRGTSGGI